MDKQDTAAHIKAIIDQSDLTQREVAAGIGMEPSALNVRLNGQREFRVSEVYALSRVLNTSIGTLLGLGPSAYQEKR